MHVLQLHQADDLSGRCLRDFGRPVTVDAVDVLHGLAVPGAAVHDHRAVLHRAGEDAAGAETTDEVVHGVAERQHGERRVPLGVADQLSVLSVLPLDLPAHRRRRQIADHRRRHVVHADAGPRRAGEHRKEPPPEDRVRDAVDQHFLPGFTPVEVRFQHRIVRLRHRLHQPGPQPFRLVDELLGYVLQRVPAELPVGLPGIHVRPHRDQVDDAAEALAQPDGKLQGDGLGVQRLLHVVECAEERRPILVELVHAGEQRQGPLRRHVPMRFRLVLDAGDGGDEQKASLADGHRPVGIGEEVGEPGGVEQVEERPLVLGVGDVGRDRKVALALLWVDVEVAGGTVLRGAGRRIVAKQRLGQGGLSRTIVCDDCDIADRFRIEHALVSPDAALKRERLDQPAALVEEGRCAS